MTPKLVTGLLQGGRPFPTPTAWRGFSGFPSLPGAPGSPSSQGRPVPAVWPAQAAARLRHRGQAKASHGHRGLSPWATCPLCHSVSSRHLFTALWPSEIDRYFCDVRPLLKPAGTGTRGIGLWVIVSRGLAAWMASATVMGPYFPSPSPSPSGLPCREPPRLGPGQCSARSRGPALRACPLMPSRPATAFPEDRASAPFCTSTAPMWHRHPHSETRARKALGPAGARNRL